MHSCCVIAYPPVVRSCHYTHVVWWRYFPPVVWLHAHPLCDRDAANLVSGRISSQAIVVHLIWSHVGKLRTRLCCIHKQCQILQHSQGVLYWRSCFGFSLLHPMICARSAGRMWIEGGYCRRIKLCKSLCLMGGGVLQHHAWNEWNGMEWLDGWHVYGFVIKNQILKLLVKWVNTQV